MNCVREAAAIESRRSSSRVLACRTLAGFTVAVLSILHAHSLPAQQGAKPPAGPKAQQSSSGNQRPGAGAQLRTEAADGLSADARLLNLLADHRYRSIEAQLDSLPPEQAQFYRGILANRSNDLAESIQLLEPLVDRVAESSNTAREKLLRKALAEDYLRLGEWAKAADAYQALDARLNGKLSADEQDEIEMPLKLLPLVRDNSPTTVEPCEPFKLQVSEDPLGLIDIPVFVDVHPRNWMLDPTLPFDLISLSTAKAAGLKISTASATVSTLTGRPIQIRATVIPHFAIGGRLTLHDMTAFVYDDKDYFFPDTSYQVEGVLGYPALAAIGGLTVTSDNTIFVRPAKQLAPPEEDDRLTTGARFYLDGDQVIVALGRAGNAAGDPSRQPGPGPPGKGIAGAGAAGNSAGAAEDERMFAIDAGGQQTYLTSRYFDEHAAQFNGQKTEMFSYLGPESPPQPAYLAESVPLQVGETSVTLHYIHVLTQPAGSAHDDVYGVLGTDALGQLKSYTFDYRTMRFAVTVE
jgi:hypothetical protein